MATGALVREWPKGYSVWNEDTSAPDGSGYRLLQTYKNDPTREIMNELYDVRTFVVCCAPEFSIIFFTRVVNIIILVFSFITHTLPTTYSSVILYRQVICLFRLVNDRCCQTHCMISDLRHRIY